MVAGAAEGLAAAAPDAEREFDDDDGESELNAAGAVESAGSASLLFEGSELILVKLAWNGSLSDCCSPDVALSVCKTNVSVVRLAM